MENTSNHLVWDDVKVLLGFCPFRNELVLGSFCTDVCTNQIRAATDGCCNQNLQCWKLVNTMDTNVNVQAYSVEKTRKKNDKFTT